MNALGLFVATGLVLCGQVSSSCLNLNYCNGHGRCNGQVCNCYEGWGAATDITSYHSPDCSARTCPSGRSWGDMPSAQGHAHVNLEECSGRGKCNKVTGACQCFTGFTGSACQRAKCINDCSGHGRCLSMKQLAQDPDAFPLTFTSENYITTNVRATMLPPCHSFYPLKYLLLVWYDVCMLFSIR